MNSYHVTNNEENTMKLDKETKAFISDVVKYAVSEAVKQANEEARQIAESSQRPVTTFEARRAKAAEVKATHDRTAVA